MITIDSAILGKAASLRLLQGPVSDTVRKSHKFFPDSRTSKVNCAYTETDQKTIIDPWALRDKLYELFNDRPFAGLLILKLDMVDERDSPLGIGYKSTGRAPSGKCFRIDVCADSDIATAFN